MNRKRSALENRYYYYQELSDYVIAGTIKPDKIEHEELSDDEIEQLISEIDSPLTHLYEGGYRLYDNNIEWICHFCKEIIPVHKGYWGRRDMQWSAGSKLCHRCFLKFILMMEENRYLMLLFENIRGKELDILGQLASSR